MNEPNAFLSVKSRLGPEPSHPSEIMMTRSWQDGGKPFPNDHAQWDVNDVRDIHGSHPGGEMRVHRGYSGLACHETNHQLRSLKWSYSFTQESQDADLSFNQQLLAKKKKKNPPFSPSFLRTCSKQGFKSFKDKIGRFQLQLKCHRVLKFPARWADYGPWFTSG